LVGAPMLCDRFIGVWTQNNTFIPTAARIQNGN
jgi:hypothetical protein